jgi:Nucleotide-diphospho-sugar transferase
MRIKLLQCTVFGFSLIFLSALYMNLVARGRILHQKDIYVSQSPLISAVTSRASDDKFIILTIVDEPVADMAMNFYKSSFKLHNIQNFLFVGFGAQTCVTFDAESVPCLCRTNYNGTTGAASQFNSVDFMKKMVERNSIILETLKAGFTVLLTDMDVVFLQNPMSELKVMLTHVSIRLRGSFAYIVTNKFFSPSSLQIERGNSAVDSRGEIPQLYG